MIIIAFLPSPDVTFQAHSHSSHKKNILFFTHYARLERPPVYWHSWNISTLVASIAVYTNVESTQAARGDVPAAMRAIIAGPFRRVITIPPGLISQDDVEDIITNSGAFGALESIL